MYRDSPQCTKRQLNKFTSIKYVSYFITAQRLLLDAHYTLNI